MKTFQKLFALLLTFALTVSAFAALSPITVSAEEDGYEHYVTLNVSDGQIRIYADRYVQNGVEHEGFSFENTLYTITGGVRNADTVLRVIHNAEDAAPATVHIVFRDLYIYPQTWCSVVHFTSGLTGSEEDATPVLTVDLRLEGRNYVAGYNHPGISGNAIVNLSAAYDSYSVFTSEYDPTVESFGTLKLHRVGDYEVKVNGEIAELDAGKSGKPVTITGSDSAALVKAAVDALPAASAVTTTDKDAITAARQAYNALSPAKKTEIDADTLGHLTDDEAALAAVEEAAAAAAVIPEPEPEPEPEPKRAPNLTALWIVLGFLCGAGCAVGVTLFVVKKKAAPTDPDFVIDPETEKNEDTAD